MRKTNKTNSSKAIPSFSKLQREAINLYNDTKMVKKGSTHRIRSPKYPSVQYIYNFSKEENPRNNISITFDGQIGYREVFKRVDFRYKGK